MCSGGNRVRTPFRMNKVEIRRRFQGTHRGMFALRIPELSVSDLTLSVVRSTRSRLD